MDLQLKGKAALVLASSGGLGLAIATELAREGAGVMLFGRSDERLAVARQHVERETGHAPASYTGDVTRTADLAAAVERTRETFGPVYVLVNNCGGPKPGTFAQLTDDDWQAAFELTLLSYVRATRAALPQMRDAGGGRILNISSSSTKRALANLMLSNVYRMGVLGLTKTLAMELGPDGVLVNTVGAGKVHTDRVQQIDEARAKRTGVSVEQLHADTARAIPLGRYGKPEELARLCAFLCSPTNAYVTGQNVLVDGGQVAAY